jgi:hypothetical protein
MRKKILSIYINAIADRAYDTAHFAILLHSGTTKIIGCSVTLLVERASSLANNLSAATENPAPHFQRFAIFC